MIKLSVIIVSAGLVCDYSDTMVIATGVHVGMNVEQVSLFSMLKESDWQWTLITTLKIICHSILLPALGLLQ